jgi:hypothetical protein
VKSRPCMAIGFAAPRHVQSVTQPQKK